MFVMYSKGAAGARRIAEVLESPEELLPEPEPAAAQEPGLEPVATEKTASELGEALEVPEISFDHVSFSYGKVEENLSDISFSVRKGQTLGIIGPTGSGKSTILSLLLRFYDPDQGSIRIRGRDIRTMDKKELHSLFGAVFQNDFIYSDDIESNIRFGRDDISDERIASAIATAQADFIYEKKDGLREMLASNGSNLSGGQKQRVLLARALAGDSEILLLDDSSSALDYKTDAALRRALGADHRDATKIIIAQRVSSIKNADSILVLEDGHEAGYGTHEELMKNCESYRDIARIQMGEVE